MSDMMTLGNAYQRLIDLQKERDKAKAVVKRTIKEIKEIKEQIKVIRTEIK